MSLFAKLKKAVMPIPRPENLWAYAGLSLYVLSLNTSVPALPDDFTKEQLLEAVRQNAEETKQSTDLSIFTYRQEEEQVAPIFTSPEAAQAFVQRGPSTEATFLTLAELNGSFLWHYLLDNGFSQHRIVLNPRTDQERFLTQDELRAAVG